MTRAHRPPVPGHTEQPMPTYRPGHEGMHARVAARVAARLADRLPAIPEDDHVVGMLLDRARIGMTRYGAPLQAHSGRDASRDLLEELVDGLVYAEQFTVERPHDTRATHVRDTLTQLCRVAVRLHRNPAP